MQDMWEMNTLERRYSVPPSTISDPTGRNNPVEDLHAWSIYRQNINSGFTDSALGSSEKSSPPYGNFKLRQSTVNSILSHPKYGPSRRVGGATTAEAAGGGNSIYSYLKFGLPRVFPPTRLGRDGSSGYDSSDDGTGTGRQHRGPSPSVLRTDRFRRSRSDPDFRKARPDGRATGGSRTGRHRQPSEVATVDAARVVSDASGQGYWRKSSSEANLPSAASHASEERRRYRVFTKNGGADERESAVGSVGAVAATAADGHHQAAQSTYRRDKTDKRSRAGSQMSGLTHTTASSRTHVGAFNALAQAGGLYLRDAQLLNEKFFPKDAFMTTFLGDIEGGVFKHPHLQVRHLSYEVEIETGCGEKALPYGEDRCRLLDDITLEIHGGEIMAVMATSEEEGTLLLDILANRHRTKHARLRGDVVVNGVAAQPDKLEDRVSYVQQECTHTLDMSVRQTLLFTSLLKEPGNPSRGFDTKGRINALIEDLGLGLVKHTRVKHLTLSEKRRLNVACHLLLDTDIVLLDQPTKGMDIFDTFFLVEYLRQWAARGRIVILTIHPPTYEIFTMMSKIALLSSGRLMYFGKRREMLPYFAFIEFPCPAYKNPSDYYLDLITLDNLSAEAMLESSERIKLLADTFQSRQEPLSDPGPPGIPPPKVKSANLLVQILALWIRALIYMFPYNLIAMGKNIFFVALMSVLIGAIYENVRLGTEQDQVQDRFGFHYVMMGVAIWPLLFLTISDVWHSKDVISSDLWDGLYTKTAYTISKTTYSFLTSGAIFLAYVIPAYCMSGLKGEEDNLTFTVYLGYMLFYLFSMRSMAMAMAYTFDSRHVAAGITGLLLTLVTTCSGYPVHFLDLSVLLFWLRWVSPMRWIGEQLVVWEMGEQHGVASREDFTCAKTLPSSAQSAAIILKPPCPLANGAEALAFYGYDTRWPLYVPNLITLGFGLFWLGWVFVAFAGKRQNQKKSRRRLQQLLQ